MWIGLLNPHRMFFMAKDYISKIILAVLLSGCVRYASAPVAKIPTTVQSVMVESVPLLEKSATPEKFNTISTDQNPNWKLFKTAKVSATGYFAEQVFTVVIEVNGKLEGKYRAELDGFPYECTGQELFPSRLYCSGKPVTIGAKPQLVIYPIDVNEVIFRTTVELIKE